MTTKSRTVLCLALLLTAISLGSRGSAQAASTSPQASSTEGCACAVEPPWPAWVFGHIVWEDESTTASVHEMVNGYQAAGIPVDGIIIDSPWETAYNTFAPDPKRYPDMKQLIADMHAKDIRVIMWITPNVNLDDPEYQSALDNHFFVRGFENKKWWKGPGGWIDYDNPTAMAWWHARMDRAIDLGLDGWKTDGTDPYLLPKGWAARQRYATQYYSDFYDYTRARTGGKQVIMARPYESGVDERTLNLPGWANPLGLAVWLKFAPIDKSWASWVGDQDPTFDGMTIARRRILYSAARGYLILGSDIGGYREKDGQGPQKEIFIRWAQFGALCPFMENGGGGEHRAFKFDKETTDIYRQLVLLHKALLPYLYSEAVEAWGERHSLINPLREGKDEYTLGHDILVAPVTAPGGKVRVVLPRGNDWMPLFADESYLKDAADCVIEGAEVPLLRGGCSFTRVYPLSQYPVFLRAGALIPLVRKWAEPLLGGPAVADCPRSTAPGTVAECPGSAAEAGCQGHAGEAGCQGQAGEAGCQGQAGEAGCRHGAGAGCPKHSVEAPCPERQAAEAEVGCPYVAGELYKQAEAAEAEAGCPYVAGELYKQAEAAPGCCAAGGGLPSPVRGDLVLVVPLAPGKSSEVGRIIYMEGKEPVEVGGRLSAVDGFEGDLKTGPDWQALVAPDLVPAR